MLSSSSEFILPYIRHRTIPSYVDFKINDSIFQDAIDQYVDDYKKPHPVISEFASVDVPDQFFYVDQHEVEISTVYGIQIIKCNNFIVAVKILGVLYYDWKQCLIKMPSNAIPIAYFFGTEIIDFFNPNVPVEFKLSKLFLLTKFSRCLCFNIEIMLSKFLSDDEYLVVYKRNLGDYININAKAGTSFLDMNVLICNKINGLKAKMQYDEVSVYNNRTNVTNKKATVRSSSSQREKLTNIRAAILSLASLSRITDDERSAVDAALSIYDPKFKNVSYLMEALANEIHNSTNVPLVVIPEQGNDKFEIMNEEEKKIYQSLPETIKGTVTMRNDIDHHGGIMFSPALFPKVKNCLTKANHTYAKENVIVVKRGNMCHPFFVHYNTQLVLPFFLFSYVSDYKKNRHEYLRKWEYMRLL